MKKSYGATWVLFVFAYTLYFFSISSLVNKCTNNWLLFKTGVENLQFPIDAYCGTYMNMNEFLKLIYANVNFFFPIILIFFIILAKKNKSLKNWIVFIIEKCFFFGIWGILFNSTILYQVAGTWFEYLDIMTTYIIFLSISYYILKRLSEKYK